MVDRMVVLTVDLMVESMVVWRVDKLEPQWVELMVAPRVDEMVASRVER